MHTRGGTEAMNHDELREAFADVGAEPFGVSIVLMVDSSGSMKPFAGAVPEAVDRFVKTLREVHAADTCRLAIVTFAERGEIALGFTPLTADVGLPRFEPEGGTRLVDTVRDVMVVLLQREWSDGEHVVVAIITDGKDTASSPEGRWEMQSLALRARARDWTLLTFGIGTDALVAARSLGFPDDPASAQTLERRAESLFESLASVSSRSIPPGASGVRPVDK
jgi:Mg-chelatase subunit ChlD